MPNNKKIKPCLATIRRKANKLGGKAFDEVDVTLSFKFRDWFKAKAFTDYCKKRVNDAFLTGDESNNWIVSIVY